MKRRNFISTVAAASALPILFGNTRIARSKPFHEMIAASSPKDNENILVLIQLNGGNDGLNTVVPVKYYDGLSKARPNLIVPKDQLLAINEENAFHPAIAELHSLYQEGIASVVQSVSYPEPNLSHFRATDIWTSGSGSEKYVSSGWLGRYLSLYHPDYPDSYPTSKFPDPLSLTIGSLVSTTCQGFVYNMGMAFNSFDDFYNLRENQGNHLEDTFAGDHIDFINTLIEQTNVYTKSLEAAKDKGTVTDDLYPDTPFGRRMKTAVHLINGGLKTKIYVIGLSGFDTHAGQIETASETAGSHADLLSQVSKSINAAISDLEKTGRDGKVLFMTFSEFGRRIQENASLGTDHGTAAPLIFAGAKGKLNNTVHGYTPIINERVEVQDNIPMQYDYRSVYYSVLKDWFEVPDEDFDAIMLQGFEYVPILNTDGKSVDEAVEIAVYPNPASDFVTIGYGSQVGMAYHVVDLSGRSIARLQGGIANDIRNLPSGTYLVRSEDGGYSGKFTKR